MFISAFSRLPMMLQAIRRLSPLTAFVFILCLCGVTSITLAQNKRQKPPATEAEEYYDDPPARFALTGLSPGMISVSTASPAIRLTLTAAG
jgi:hypothetical protein